MVTVLPFRGHLASKHFVKKIICRPYDVLNTAEARAIAHGNPQSFLHVKRAEIDLPEDTDRYSNLVYQTAKYNLDNFIQFGWMEQDTESRYYIYSQEYLGKKQFGLMCTSSVSDYENNLVRKSEKTILEKEQDRTRLTDTLSANTGPVCLTYRSDDNRAI